MPLYRNATQRSDEERVNRITYNGIKSSLWLLLPMLRKWVSTTREVVLSTLSSFLSARILPTEYRSLGNKIIGINIRCRNEHSNENSIVTATLFILSIWLRQTFVRFARIIPRPRIIELLLWTIGCKSYATITREFSIIFTSWLPRNLFAIKEYMEPLVFAFATMITSSQCTFHVMEAISASSLKRLQNKR